MLQLFVYKLFHKLFDIQFNIYHILSRITSIIIQCFI